MKRIRIPGIVDIVSSDDAAEIEAFAKDPKLDRAYADHSIPVNGKVLQRVQNTLQIGEKPLPTVAPRCAEGRATAQDALWKRLNAIAPAYAAGPEELESLAAFVRGEGSADACGPLVQQAVGSLFVSNFKATEDSWNAALVLDQAPRTMNLALLARLGADEKGRSRKAATVGLGGRRPGRGACDWSCAPQHRERCHFDARTL